MKLTLSAVLGLVLVSAAGCGSNPSPTAPTSPADVTITIQGNAGGASFSPSLTTIKFGQTVGFRNTDSTAHNVVEDGSRFAVGSLNGATVSGPILIASTGTFVYHCTTHPGMVGAIVVQ